MLYGQDVLYLGHRHVLVTTICRGAIQGLTLVGLEPASDHNKACERFVLSRYASNCPEELIVNQLKHAVRVTEILSEANAHTQRYLTRE